MKPAIVAVAVLLGLHVLDAQTFRVAIDAVSVDVLVTDGKRPVGGLTVADFELLDSTVPQVITAAAMDDVPISLMVALDTSDSVKGDVLTRLKEGASAALAMLRAPDRAALITFSSVVSLVAPWGADRATVAAAVAGARPGGGTSLFDASFTALQLRDDKAGQRNLAVVFSDGDDTGSWLPDRAVVDKAHRTETVVYSIVMNDTGSVTGRPDDLAARSAGANREGAHLMARSGIELSPPQVRSILQGSGFLADLATATGGQRFVVTRPSELRAAFTPIVTDFRSRYVLTYTPTGVDARGWHPIEVKVKGRGVTVRARRGYSR
jgi:VWFA-related protein